MKNPEPKNRMSISELKLKVSPYFVNCFGWRTSRKIIVFESDDWGSIRMPSKGIYNKCLNAGYPVNLNPYERYDSLLSQKDLELFFELLTKYKDKNGNHPIFTANCVVANPDFEKIRINKFERYYYELISETFKHYPEHSNNLNIWKQGIVSNIFFPQFHAREHLNVSLFMDALNQGNVDVHFGFDNQMPGIITRGSGVSYNYYVGSTEYHSYSDKKSKLEIYLEGLDLFENIFGYKSETVIPPNYIWSLDYNEAVLEKGVKYFQGVRKIREPGIGGKDIFHTFYLGKKNVLGQRYLIRNAFFEPSLSNHKVKDPVDSCLSAIEIAFRMNKPVLISSHRINYVGFIDEKNRDNSLRLLDKLLRAAINRWPDIEFMTSDKLGNLMAQSYNDQNM